MQIETSESAIKMQGVREYGEGFDVELDREASTGRLVIRAKNEGGYNETIVDLRDLIDWVMEHGTDGVPPPPSPSAK